MKNIVLKYGLLSSTIIIISAIITIVLVGDVGDFYLAEWLGYLVMVVAFSMIFIGIKDYKNKNDDLIDFKTAFKVGIAISLVASLLYIIGWEIYFSINGEQFIAAYTEKAIKDLTLAIPDKSDLEIEKKDFLVNMDLYKELPYRVTITFIEIFPIAFIVTLISSFILRTKSKN